MHIALPISRRARAALAAAVAATALSLAPAPAAEAAPTAATVSAECSAAQAALAQAQRQQRVAKGQAVKARKALAKAKKTHKRTKIRKAQVVLKRANTSVASTTRTVAAKAGRLGYACAAPNSAVRAQAAGKSLSILAAAQGITAAPVDLDQLVALLDRFLPGVAGKLTEGQLNAILAGFGVFAEGSEVSPADALTILGSAFSTAQVTALLDGVADPTLVADLVRHIRTQLGGLAGVSLPSTFDPTTVLDTLAGIFGNLDPTQLGKLLALVNGILDGELPDDTAGLGDLLDALSFGLSGVFDEDQLNAMLAALTGGTPPASVVANLLGGQLTAEQIGTLLDGEITPADQELAGEVFAQVLAQLGTGGSGDLPPITLDTEELVNLFYTVSGQLQGFFCTLVPLLCP